MDALVLMDITRHVGMSSIQTMQLLHEILAVIFGAAKQMQRESHAQIFSALPRGHKSLREPRASLLELMLTRFRCDRFEID